MHALLTSIDIIRFFKFLFIIYSINVLSRLLKFKKKNKGVEEEGKVSQHGK